MSERLRIALLAGTLQRGGAEKQLFYTARSLAASGCEVRVYCLSRGGFYQAALQDLRISVVHVEPGHPLVRLKRLLRVLRPFAPHVVHSMHAFANLYATMAARNLDAIDVGALRSDLEHCRQANGLWTRLLLRAPGALVVNSFSAYRELAEGRLVRRERLYMVPNVVDSCGPPRVVERAGRGVKALFAGRLISHKRGDRFLRALALARRVEPALTGTVVGDGPDLAMLSRLAGQLALGPPELEFLGERDVSGVLNGVDMLVLSSDHEGTPNVILEAMAAALPVITTPAGDAPAIVRDGSTGFVVPFNGEEIMAERMIRLARSPGLRRKFGDAGQALVQREFNVERLSARLMQVYGNLAKARHLPEILSLCRCE